MKGDIGHNLTVRELSILRLVAQGFIYEKIADILRIAPQTVKNYMILIRAKLDARTTPHAVAIAKDRKLI